MPRMQIAALLMTCLTENVAATQPKKPANTANPAPAGRIHGELSQATSDTLNAGETSSSDTFNGMLR